ncbi:MAG: hypothetical protein ACYC3I_25685, partial [Gemmataceae bacterium]
DSVFTATLDAVGPWQPPTIRYRPALPEEVMEFQFQRDQAKGRDKMKPTVEFLRKHLVSWDVRDDNGETTAATAENLRRLPFVYQALMLDYVMGYAGGAEVQS